MRFPTNFLVLPLFGVAEWRTDRRIMTPAKTEHFSESFDPAWSEDRRTPSVLVSGKDRFWSQAYLSRKSHTGYIARQYLH